MIEQKTYLGNPLLKSAYVPQNFSEEQVEEYIKCQQDPLYFVNKHVKIVSVDEGLIEFDVRDYQKDMINRFHNERFVICKMARQSGKSTTILAYLLHYILFNENVSVAVLANKKATAMELLGRLQLAYEHMPKWLQQGILIWNKGNIELENGSKILASSTSGSAIFQFIGHKSQIEMKNGNRKLFGILLNDNFNKSLNVHFLVVLIRLFQQINSCRCRLRILFFNTKDWMYIKNQLRNIPM